MAQRHLRQGAGLGQVVHPTRRLGAAERGGGERRVGGDRAPVELQGPLKVETPKLALALKPDRDRGGVPIGEGGEVSDALPRRQQLRQEAVLIAPEGDRPAQLPGLCEVALVCGHDPRSPPASFSRTTTLSPSLAGGRPSRPRTTLPLQPG